MIKNFWKCSIITEKEFFKRAQTGDILLFRSQDFNNKIQLNKDEFDHISMVVRYQNEQIYLFEASYVSVSVHLADC